LGLIDLFHQNQQIAFEVQSLIWEINENYPEVFYKTTINTQKLNRKLLQNNTNIDEWIKYESHLIIWSDSQKKFSNRISKISSNVFCLNRHSLLIDTNKIPFDVKKAFELIELITKN
jgi:hypothetical protein